MGAPDVRIEAATLQHAEELARVMRASDAAELLASGMGSPFEGLVESMRRSDMTFAAVFNGEVAAIWGVGPVDPRETLLGGPRVGVAWALTGRMVDKHPKAFLRVCRPALRRLFEVYPVLVNAIDARYGRSLRWARWLGFDVGQATAFGPSGLPFHWISVRRTDGRVH